MRNAIVVVLAIAAIGVSAAGAATPPPGATATCRDGTYSFSQTHSGTCSHHRGVAVWLDAKSRGAVAAPRTTVDVGVTMLLAKRTRTGGCTLGLNPDRRCSPGAYYSKLTKTVICSASFHTAQVRHVPESEKFSVERSYGMTAKHYGAALEIDHIVALELGGSNDIANLFPERAGPTGGYRVKDALENRVHAMVCSGAIGLRAAQIGIAANWQHLYARVFGRSP